MVTNSRVNTRELINNLRKKQLNNRNNNNNKIKIIKNNKGKNLEKIKIKKKNNKIKIIYKKKNIKNKKCEGNKKNFKENKEINGIEKWVKINNNNTQKNTIKSNEGENQISKSVIKKSLKEKYNNNKDRLELSVPQLYPRWEEPPEENTWVIGTLNCHGVNKLGEILAFSSLFRAMKADIMILIET